MQMVPSTAMTEATAHTRAGTTATLFNKLGVLVAAVANALRVTYDPADLTAAPYALIEGAATNYALYSRQLENAYWSKYLCTVSTEAAIGLDGVAYMDMLTATSTGSAVVYRTGVTTGQMVLSAVLKAGTGNTGLLSVDGVGSAQFDLATGGLGTVGGGASYITSFGGGRYLCEFAYEDAAGSATINIGMNGAQIGSTIYVSDIQCEPGTRATSRIVTTSAAGVRPADVLGVGTFTDCSLTENDTDDAPLWAAGAKTVGQLVRRANAHRVYECLIAHTAGASDYPEVNLTGTTPKWLELRPTNKYAAFDTVIASQAVGTTTGGGDASTLVYVLRPGKACNVAALFNLDATRVTVSVVDSAGVLRYQRTENLRLRNCRSWSEWFFKPITRRRDFAFTGLPYYANATLVITVQKPGSVAKLGDLVVGRSEYLGEIQWEPEVRHVDYSRVVTDAFGVTKFVKRNNAKLLSCDLFVLNEEFDETNRLLGLYSSTALAFVGDERFQSTIVLGFVQDSRAVLKDPAGSFIYVQIQGLS